MMPEPAKRRIKLAIKWVDGQWVLKDGHPIPEVKNGAEAVLSVAVDCLLHVDDQERFTQERRVKLLEADTLIFARVNYDNIPVEIMEHATVLPHLGRGENRFVEVNLGEPLYMSVSVGKKAGLLPCHCQIPALGDTAESVNEAYKKIATNFDPSRRSNVGNAFSVMYVELGGSYVTLGELRQKKLPQI